MFDGLKCSPPISKTNTIIFSLDDIYRQWLNRKITRVESHEPNKHLIKCCCRGALSGGWDFPNSFKEAVKLFTLPEPLGGHITEFTIQAPQRLFWPLAFPWPISMWILHFLLFQSVRGQRMGIAEFLPVFPKQLKADFGSALACLGTEVALSKVQESAGKVSTSKWVPGVWTLHSRILYFFWESKALKIWKGLWCR